MEAADDDAVNTPDEVINRTLDINVKVNMQRKINFTKMISFEMLPIFFDSSFF